MGMERNFFLPSHQAKLFPLSWMIGTHGAVRDSQVRSTEVHNRIKRSPRVCPTTPFHRTECSACCLECQARWMARPDGRGNVNCAWQTPKLWKKLGFIWQLKNWEEWSWLQSGREIDFDLTLKKNRLDPRKKWDYRGYNTFKFKNYPDVEAIHSAVTSAEKTDLLVLSNRV